VRVLTNARTLAALLLGAIALAGTAFTGTAFTGTAFTGTALTGGGLLAAVGLTLAALVLALMAQSGRLASALATGPQQQRTAALRRKSWGAVYQRQLNPDAAGRARPRAPGAATAAA
jgi:uncharacterized protein DUF6412